MKKLSVIFLLVTICILVFSVSSSAKSSFTVDNLDVIADVRSDGSVLVTEDWTVSFKGESESFSREIVIPEEILESFSSVSDISVSVDGNGCNYDDDGSAMTGTYSVSQQEDRYVILWNNRTEDSTHIFSLRYVLNSCVKLYKDDAYFSCTAVNGDSGLVCRNVTVEVKLPGESFAEDYTILSAGSLAGQKGDGSVSFSAYNTAGEVKVSLRLPRTIFAESSLITVAEDRTVLIAVCSISGVIAAALCALIIYYILHYREIFRKDMEKKCRRKAFDESSYSVYADIFRSVSAAKLLSIVTEKTVSGADRFIVGFLELVLRGYITVTADGFVVNEETDCDFSGRQQDRCDKIIIDFFCADDWSTDMRDPEKIYNMIEDYNRKLGFVNPFTMFVREKRKLIIHSFELKLSASGHEFITPEEISDNIIRGGKYTLSDLVVSLLNEYVLTGKKSFVRPDTSKYKRNMFMLRDIYEKGREISEYKEMERLMEKKKRKKRPVTDDDFDSE